MVCSSRKVSAAHIVFLQRRRTSRPYNESFLFITLLVRAHAIADQNGFAHSCVYFVLMASKCWWFRLICHVWKLKRDENSWLKELYAYNKIRSWFVNQIHNYSLMEMTLDVYFQLDLWLFVHSTTLHNLYHYIIYICTYFAINILVLWNWILFCLDEN